MKKEVYLGLDCGSVSIKFACLDKDKNNIFGKYLRNKGLIETVKKGFEIVKEKNPDLEIKGVGVTGSGRDFTSVLVGADDVRTEILAHSIATLHYFPEVKTIFDIGGEDCKIMTIENGVMSNFIMNNICGAGTGAVIESIAGRLGVPIEEVGDIALKYKNQLDFPGKCGVFTQSAVVSRLNTGVSKNDIMMGVCRALVNNYLMLAKSIKLHPPFVFQGATAQNKALVKALEEQLDSKVHIPQNCALMGAIGSALLVLENRPDNTKFKGFDLIGKDLETRNFRCKDCPNRCELTQIVESGQVIGSIGSRCGKYDVA